MSTVRCGDGSLFERGPRSIRVAGIAGENTLHLVSSWCLWLCL